MTRAEADAIFAAQDAKRQAGLCVIPDCENLNEGRTLDRCREHGGCNPIPARSHRSLQVSGWRKQWEG